MSALTVGKTFDVWKDIRYTWRDGGHKEGTDLYIHNVVGTKHFDIDISDPNMLHFDISSLPGYETGMDLTMVRKDGFTYFWINKTLFQIKVNVATLEIKNQITFDWNIEMIFVGGGGKIFVLEHMDHLNNRYSYLENVNLTPIYASYPDTINHRVEVVNMQ